MHEWGHYFEILGIEPTPFIKKMRSMIENDGSYDAADYARYEKAMEAVCSRKPGRMNANGMEMLLAKVGTIADPTLRAHAMAMYEELEAEVIGDDKPEEARKMNKREAEKLMRSMTWNVCMLDRVPSERDVEDLKSVGYELERMSIAGMDGFAVSKDGVRVSYIAAPRKRNPGKKQTCTMYEWSDVWHFAKADAALACGDVAFCMAHLASIGAASLHNEICEGLERNYQGMLNDGESACVAHADAAKDAEAIHVDEPEDEPAPILDELDQVRALLGNPSDVEVSRKREGACIWAIGNTQPMKELLKSLGFRWAPKRQGWYWKPQAA